MLLGKNNPILITVLPLCCRKKGRKLIIPETIIRGNKVPQKAFNFSQRAIVYYFVRQLPFITKVQESNAGSGWRALSNK